MFKRLFKAALVFGMAALAPPAAAQGNCAPRDNIVDRLQSTYGEALAAGGVISSTMVLEVWTSPESGGFTVLMTRADGTSCVIAAGSNWHGGLPTKPPSGTPS